VSPTVAVIIPVYNGARYVRRAIESALAQTRPADEVIVLDDASTDATNALARAVSPAVRVIRHERNGGLSAARNTAVRAAAGEWVALLDSDDWWGPTRLAEQLALVTACPDLDFVFADFAHFAPDGTPGQWQGGTGPLMRARRLTLTPAAGGWELTGPVADDLIRNMSYIHPSTVLMRRTVFDRVGWFAEDVRAAEDLEMWIRIAAAGCRFGYVDRVLVSVEQRPDSLSHNAIKMLEGYVRVYSGLPRVVPNLSPEMRRVIRRTCGRHHAALGWWYREAGDPRRACRNYLRALGYGFDPRAVSGMAKAVLGLAWGRRRPRGV
jgi:glycosyltransferase involved in cell wall biosynthesis